MSYKGCMLYTGFVSVSIVINMRVFVSKEKDIRVIEKGRNSWVGG
jgi:hypothetical protein